SPAMRASASSKGISSIGPAKNVARRLAFSWRRALLAAPYQSSKATTDDTATVLLPATARRKRRRSWGEVPLIRAMQALVPRNKGTETRHGSACAADFGLRP